jgi:cell division protein FtsB
MRLVIVVLVVLLVLIQYPLWWGHGGWLRVHELREALDAQAKKNAGEKLRNQRIEGEVQDLQNGTAAVEERARYEMGMVKDGEVFVQFVSPNAAASAVATASAGNDTSTRGEMSAAPVAVVPNPVSRVKQRGKAEKGEKRRAGEKAGR